MRQEGQAAVVLELMRLGHQLVALDLLEPEAAVGLELLEALHLLEVQAAPVLLS